MVLKEDKPIFLSTYTNRVDYKNRVSVPARYRSSLSQFKEDKYLIVFPSLVYPAIDCCGLSFMYDLVRSTEVNLLEKRTPFGYLIMSSVKELLIDVNGRVILDEAMKKHASITNKVTFIGQGNKFQIWNPENAESYIEKMRKEFLKKEKVGAVD